VGRTWQQENQRKKKQAACWSKENAGGQRDFPAEEQSTRSKTRDFDPRTAQQKSKVIFFIEIKQGLHNRIPLLFNYWNINLSS
jgi:hypothetical protein